MTVKAINKFGESWRQNIEESLYLRVYEGEIRKWREEGEEGREWGRETWKERK